MRAQTRSDRVDNSFIQLLSSIFYDICYEPLVSGPPRVANYRSNSESYFYITALWNGNSMKNIASSLSSIRPLFDFYSICNL